MTCVINRKDVMRRLDRTEGLGPSTLNIAATAHISIEASMCRCVQALSVGISKVPGP